MSKELTNYSYKELHDLYETVQNNSKYTDKALALKKELKKRQRQENFENVAGDVAGVAGTALIKVPAAAVTAPIWILALLLMAPTLNSIR